MQDGLSRFLEDFSRSERDLRFFIEHLPFPLLLCRGWEVVYLNSISRQILPGIDPSTLAGANFLDFLEEPERSFLDSNFDRIRDGDFYRLKVTVRFPEGSFKLDSLLRIISLADDNYAVIALQDLSLLSAREKNLFRILLDSYALSGPDLYDEIVRQLVVGFDVNCAALIECRQGQHQSAEMTMVAGILDSRSLRGSSFARNSLVERVFQKGTIIIDRGLVEQKFESDFVQSNGLEAFVGVRLLAAGDTDLALCVFSRKPLHDSAGLCFALSVCGMRIAADYCGRRSKADYERQERDYRLLVEQSADAMFVVNPAGTILLANNRAAELTGFPKTELANFFDLIAESSRPFFRGFFHKRFGVLDHANVVVIHKSGSRHYCELSGVILSDGRIQLNARDNTEHLLTEIALKQSEAKYRSIFDNASDGIFLSDRKSGRILDSNRSFQKLFGRDREATLRMTHFEIVQPKDRGRFRRIFEHRLAKGRLDREPGKLRVTIENDQGQLRRVEVAMSRLDREGNQLIVGIIRDLSVSDQADEEQRKYLQTLTMLNVVVIELDESLHIQFCNNPMSKFGAALSDDLRGRFFPKIAAEDFQWYVEVVLGEMLLLKKGSAIRFPCRSGQSGFDWYEVDFVYLHDRGHPPRLRGLIKDVTFDYIVEKQGILMANTDILTSLPNRNRLEEDLFRGLLRADRLEKKLAVGFIDLDRFFDVNDLLGHRLGDMALAFFAERIRSLPGSEWNLYRWGGDQFVFIVESVVDVASVRELLDRIRATIREPLNVEGHTLHISCTVGVSLYPDDARTVDGLFGQADRALQSGKRNGRSRFLLAQDIQKDLVRPDRMSVRNHLSFAISHGLVEPYVQPIFDLHSGRFYAMEALARIADIPEFSAIGPEVFIPVAEDLGLIEELSNLILVEALAYQKHLRAAGHDLRLSVNLSRRVLYSNRLMEYFNRLLLDTGADPRKICLEITETIAMLDIKNASDRLSELRELGFRVAIDDFGTGYSTLGQLYEIPADELKIDKLFVRRIQTHEGQRIAEAIVSMARALDLDVVAEGVEDVETVNLLRSMGVRFLQGYYFSPPVGRDEFENRLRGESEVTVGL